MSAGAATGVRSRRESVVFLRKHDRMHLATHGNSARPRFHTALQFETHRDAARRFEPAVIGLADYQAFPNVTPRVDTPGNALHPGIEDTTGHGIEQDPRRIAHIHLPQLILAKVDGDPGCAGVDKRQAGSPAAMKRPSARVTLVTTPK
jgi:hypothetical protein